MENSSVTLEELKCFHRIDREVYARLALNLGFDSNSSMKILAFWNWAERCGCTNFVWVLLGFDDAMLQVWAEEAIRCIKSLSEGQPILPPDPMKFQCYASFLSYIYDNREIGKGYMNQFIKDVGVRIFGDVIPALNKLVVNGPPRAQTLPIQMGNLDLSAQEADGGHVAPQKESPQMENSPVLAQETPDDYVGSLLEVKDRTLFVTFSRGHPISKQELKDFINRSFGNCVEAIRMKDNAKEQSLFACVVLETRAAITEILGGQQIAKISVNGKHFRARRFKSKH